MYLFVSAYLRSIFFTEFYICHIALCIIQRKNHSAFQRDTNIVIFSFFSKKCKCLGKLNALFIIKILRNAYIFHRFKLLLYTPAFFMGNPSSTRAPAVYNLTTLYYAHLITDTQIIFLLLRSLSYILELGENDNFKASRHFRRQCPYRLP